MIKTLIYKQWQYYPFWDFLKIDHFNIYFFNEAWTHSKTKAFVAYLFELCDFLSREFVFLPPKKVFGAKIFDNFENNAMNSTYP